MKPPKSLDDYTQEARELVTEIQPSELEEYLSMGWTLIDVREADEFEAGHLEGAVNFPRGMLEVYADQNHFTKDERLQDRDKRIVCYCGGGNRSLLAARVLLEMGFADVVSLSGGWRRWTEENRPTTR